MGGATATDDNNARGVWVTAIAILRPLRTPRAAVWNAEEAAAADKKDDLHTLSSKDDK